jgi:hypothetical protein
VNKVRERAPRFRVGDWVSFPYGTSAVWAQIVEDRGPLGVNHRRLYRVRIDEDSGEPVSFEMREDDLTPAVPEKAAVLQYLKEGGLVAILQASVAGGRSQPRVWLTFDPRGGVTHTFTAERGLTGGAKAPRSAVYEDKIFTPKQEQVVEFLTTFNLTRAEAEEVVRTVGTAPI